MSTRHLIALRALSPLHLGSGGGEDETQKTIQKDSLGWPIIWGSSLRGVLRDQDTDDALRQECFGPVRGQTAGPGGAADGFHGFLVLLPVKSVKGVFAWVTSPLVLERVRAQLMIANLDSWEDLGPLGEEECRLGPDSCLMLGERVLLGEHGFRKHRDDCPVDLLTQLGALFFPGDSDWSKRLCVIPDEAMAAFWSLGLERRNRIALDGQTKTVIDGMFLDYEDLPRDSRLLSFVDLPACGSESGNRLFTHLKELCSRNGKPRLIQLGGMGSVGLGLTQASLVQGRSA